MARKKKGEAVTERDMQLLEGDPMKAGPLYAVANTMRNTFEQSCEERDERRSFRRELLIALRTIGRELFLIRDEMVKQRVAGGRR